MLGEKIQELQGRITGVRVLAAEDGGVPRVEVSFQATGKILDRSMTEFGTYVSRAQADGTLFGEGTGMIITANGETVSWTGNGRARPSGKGMAASWRGSIYFSTTSAELKRLNGLCTVFDWEVDEEGGARGSVWEWK